MCTRSVIYIFWFKLTSPWQERRVPTSSPSSYWVWEAILCTCLKVAQYERGRKSGMCFVFSFLSTLLSIRPPFPDSLRCRSLGDWFCEDNNICFKTRCCLQVYVLLYNFNKYLIACFFAVRDDMKVEKYTYRNEMKIINKPSSISIILSQASWDFNLNMMLIEPLDMIHTVHKTLLLTIPSWPGVNGSITMQILLYAFHLNQRNLVLCPL